MCNSDLPFSYATANKLMAVASDARLIDPANARFLPRKLGVLAHLTKLDDRVFENAIKAGVINPDMIERDVRAMRKLAPAEKGPKVPTGLLDTATDLNKSIGACTTEELVALAKRAEAAARFFWLLSADLAPMQVCADNITKKRSIELKRKADVPK